MGASAANAFQQIPFVGRFTTTTHFGNPYILTIRAMGHDVMTAMGARNLSLVAAGVSIPWYGTGHLPTPVIGQMRLPEPGWRQIGRGCGSAHGSSGKRS